jgi:hypothetical protein
MPYRDVIFEDSLKVGGATKAPDYCFRIGGMRKFFVEAKKPSVNIATDIAIAIDNQTSATRLDFNEGK